ncbi:diguanylate cyclase domain-containing protein [Pontibacillus salipaludis]|uniref:diguanylate cyclase domain-containing protein n=1 Tax=Pontibacillus salipaludis TaxID=1697394 RepID=UPI0031E88B1A
MVKDLIINIAIIISYIFIIGQLLQVVQLNGDYKDVCAKRKNQLLAGTLFGILGIILMEFSIQVNELVILDLRHISTIIAAVFFGIPGALLSAFIIGVSRIALFGGFNDVSVSAAIGMFAIGAVCSLLLRVPLQRGLQSLVMNIASIVIIYIDLYINVVWLSNNREVLASIYSLHWSISLVGGAVSYYVTRFILTSNQAYLSLEQSNSRLYSLVNNLPSGTLVESPDREVELYNHTFRDIYSLNEGDITVGMSSSELELRNESKYQDSSFASRIETIVHERELVLNEELLLTDGRTVERDYIPIYSSSNKFLGHMWNFRDVTDRKDMEKQLLESEQNYKSLAQLDGLTSIPNRRYFDETLNKELNRMKRYNKPLSLLLMDIDQFKRYNDTYGHLEGDHCLKEVALSIKGALKGSLDFVARYGGEEFGVILPCTDENGAYSKGEEIRAGIERLAIPHKLSSVNPHVTVSIGYTTVNPNEEIEAETMLEQADEALYLSKENGRNLVTGFSKDKVGFQNQRPE